MDPGRGKEIWDSEDRDLKLENFIQDIVGVLETVAKTNRKSYTLNALRDLLEEKNY